MSGKKKYTDAWVCVDCYFAHHYGASEHGGAWFAGESDTPADREPLALLRGFGLGDGTGENGEGSDTFSWRRCDGCGSTLAGTRYRLAIFERACLCPDDCNCHHQWRTNYCGCKAHAA